MIGRLVKFLVVVAVLVGIGIAGYAFFGDLSPAPSDQTLPVTLDAQ